MSSTFLDEKISSFIEDKFPEFVKADHPVFVEFLKLYYQFLEASKISLTNVQQTDQILLENKLTDNFMVNEFDGSKFIYEDSVFGAFIKGENVTGQISGAVVEVLAEDNASGCLYVEQNRFLQVGELIVGSVSGAKATIAKYQGNPVQNIQQLLEYVDVDDTITDFLDQFRNTYLTAVPTTLASGVSKRKLIKSVRDLYRAKGTKKGHETFFRLMFAETPELFYPTDNLLKVSAGDWSSDTVLRVVATENNPANLLGQTITQTVDIGLDALAATVNIEGVLELQEGETTVYQLILSSDSINGTFIAGAEISGIDNKNADISVSATVQSILVSANVVSGGIGYTTADTVAVSSVTGKDSVISIVDVGAGEIDQIIIDNPGTGYAVGDSVYFNNLNTEGAGASAIVSCVDGAIAPEVGDISSHTITGNLSSGSTSITNITTTTLSAANQFVLQGKVTTGTTSITNINTTTLVVGATIEGTGIPANTTIISIDTKGTSGTITISSTTTNGGTTGSISSIARSGSVATVTTASSHGLTSDDTITIVGATPQSYNGVKNINVTSNTTFTYTTDSSISTPASGTKTFVLESRTYALTHLEEGTGQKLSGNYIPIGSTIRKITTVGSSSNGTITISSAATATSSSVGIEISSEYNMKIFDHIIFDEGTEAGDAYTGNQMQIESGTLTNNAENYPTTTGGGLNLANEIGQVVNIAMFSRGSGYEVFPTVKPTSFRITWSTTALTTFSKFAAGEQITNVSGGSATLATLSNTGVATLSNVVGTFNANEVITGSSTLGFATITNVTQLGIGATYLAWSSSGIGSIAGVEVSQFGTGYSTVPSISVPIKVLLTRNVNLAEPPNITTTTAFSVGDTIIGQTSSARGIIAAWDNSRQILTVNVTLGTFSKAEILTRGASTNYAIVAEIAQGSLGSTIGTIGVTAGSFLNDKGKISESLMRIQDSFYYQDFSYVVRVGAAIADWRSQIKKAVHPAGFAMFGEVSITNKVAARLTVPVSGVLTDTPELASLFEAVLTTIVGRRLGTESDGTTLLGSTEIKGTSNHKLGTLKRGYHVGHEVGLSVPLEVITRVGTTGTIETNGPHGASAGEQISIIGVSTAGWNGVYEILGIVSDDKFTITVPNSYTTPAILSSGAKATLISPFDNSTRDVTLRSHADVAVHPIYGGWSPNQRDRYGLGPRQSNAIKYMWATPPTEYTAADTIEENQILLETGSGGDTGDLLIQEPEVLSRIDYAVTASGGAFYIDGSIRAALPLLGARLYRFDLSDSSVASHPFKFSETSDGSHSGSDVSRVDYVVTVASGTNLAGSTGNIYLIDGVARPTLTIQGARLYRFDLSDSSLSSHPFKFSVTSNGTHGGGAEYTTGVTTYGSAGSTGAYVEILTQNTSATLHYYCGNHSNMGSNLSITSRVVSGLEYTTGVTVSGTQGNAGAYIEILTANIAKTLYYYCSVHSGMGSSLAVAVARVGDYIVNEDYTGGSVSYSEDTATRMSGQMAYAYPNIIRRESPEVATDNVDAGGAGVYDTTMNYINIKISAHESNVHHRISDYADVRIGDIIKCGKEILEIGSQTQKHEGDDGYEFLTLEDGSYTEMEVGSAGIPLESRKIWNVPPSSYIRLTTA